MAELLMGPFVCQFWPSLLGDLHYYAFHLFLINYISSWVTSCLPSLCDPGLRKKQEMLQYVTNAPPPHQPRPLKLTFDSGCDLEHRHGT